jgi:hypothetical protein
LFLSDYYTLPDWLHYPVAFSLGDVLIAVGAFWLLWSLGGPRKEKLLGRKARQAQSRAHHG